MFLICISIARVAERKPYNLHDLRSTCFLGGIGATKVLRNISHRQDSIQMMIYL